jgi:hypothetical protein
MILNSTAEDLIELEEVNLFKNKKNKLQKVSSDYHEGLRKINKIGRS